MTMTSERTAYIRGWATEAVRLGQNADAALREAEQAWRARQAAEAAVLAALEGGSGVGDRAISCLACGEVLAVFVEGDRVPQPSHACA
jgi:hypothetical protein